MRRSSLCVENANFMRHLKIELPAQCLAGHLCYLVVGCFVSPTLRIVYHCEGYLVTLYPYRENQAQLVIMVD